MLKTVDAYSEKIQQMKYHLDLREAADLENTTHDWDLGYEAYFEKIFEHEDRKGE